jgi:hypothetical protein
MLATEVAMGEQQTPRNQEGEQPTRSPKETAHRLEEKADEQTGESNRASTEEKAREARAGKRRVVGFGG